MNKMLHPQTQSAHYSLARGLAALGRGPDTQLMHVSDKEVAGLQHLAMKTGGSLTRNPHTGLLEAGWLDSILPIVAGAALTATGVGAPAAALMVGAAGMAANHGDWKAGLADGLGAYGGAGVAAGLAGAGAAGSVASSGAGSGIMASDATAAGAGDAGSIGAGTLSDTAGLNGAAAQVANTQGAALAGGDTGAAMPVGSAAQKAAAQAGLQGNTFGQNLSNMGKGVGSLVGQGSGVTAGQTASDIYANTGKIGLAGLAAPAIYNSYQQSQIPTSSAPYTYYTDKYHQGTANPLFGQNGQAALVGQGYGTPTASTFTPSGYAKGGITHLDMGGALIRPELNPTQQQVSAAQPASTPPATNPPASAPIPPAPQNQGGPPPWMGQHGQSQWGQQQSSLPNFQTAPVTQGPGNQSGWQRGNPIEQYYASMMGTPSNAMPGPSQGQTNNYQSYMQNLNNQVTGAAPSGPQSMSNIGTPAWTQQVNNIANQGNGNASSLGYPTAGASPTPIRYNPATDGGFGQYASGGLATLGCHSDGGQMLKGPGDGMSDGIPATIDGHQKAALATDEFVVPADVVSHLGNGSSDAGAKKLYAMLDRVRQARTGTKSQGKQINADKFLPV
jgi:hypothetical protein